MRGQRTAGVARVARVSEAHGRGREEWGDGGTRILPVKVRVRSHVQRAGPSGLSRSSRSSSSLLNTPVSTLATADSRASTP